MHPKSTRAPLYLDYNATAPLHPQARAAILESLETIGNAASPHAFGRAQRSHLEKSRQTLMATLKAERSDEIIFTSGGTEGNATVMATFENLVRTQNATLFISSIEHASVLKAAPSATLIPVDEKGVIDLVWLRSALKALDPNRRIFISVMLVNNEMGVIQPLQDVIALAKECGAFVHTDAVQALGRIPLDLSLYPVDYMTLSSHKIGGTTGFGALYVKKGAPFMPLLVGGGQEYGYRSGTSPVLGAIACQAALVALDPTKWDPIAQLRQALETRLQSLCPAARIWGAGAPRVANTLSIYMPGVPSETQLIAFDLAGIAVSSGSACSSGKITASHVLKAMGIPDDQADQTIRVSLTDATTQQECDHFLLSWQQIYSRAQPSIKKGA